MGIISASAKCKASPEIACSKIISQEGIKAWWIGKIVIVEVDPSWPAFSSNMKWKAGGGVFDAHITQDARPKFIEMQVVTPGAVSTIRHSFEELQGGGTNYTKTIDPKWRNGFSRILWPLFLLFLRSMVKKEVKKAALFADA